MDELLQDTEIELQAAPRMAEQRERAFIEDRKDLQLEADITEKLVILFLAQAEELACRITAFDPDTQDARIAAGRSIGPAASLANAASHRLDGLRAMFERQRLVSAPSGSNPALVAGWSAAFLEMIAASCDRSAASLGRLNAIHGDILARTGTLERGARAESVIAYDELRERRAAQRQKQAA